MPVYKFRAECLNDVVNFLFNEVGGIPLKRISINFEEKFPNVDVEIETPVSLKEVKASLRGCDHSLMMAQTITLVNEE